MTTVLLTTILSILAVSTTGFFSIRMIRRDNQNTLMEQLETNLKNVIQEKVNTVDAKLLRYEHTLSLMKDDIEGLFAHADEMRALGHMIEAPVDTHEYALTRAFASDTLTADDLRDELLLFSALERPWAPIAHENEAILQTLYLGTKDGLLVSYDRYSYLSCPPEGREVVYNYFVTEWYRRGIKEDGTVYTGVYMDSQGRGLTLTLATAFKDARGNTAGVVCMDFDIAALYDELFPLALDNSTFTFALDHQQTIISPDSDTLDLQEYTGLTEDELDALKADPRGVMDIRDSIYVCITIPRVGWTLCARVPKDAIHSAIHDADASIWRISTITMGIVLLIILAATIAVNLSVRAITEPLEMLGRDIKIISNGDLSYRATVYRNDEIGDITSGMNEMVDRLNFTMNELISSQQLADDMSRLATMDALTGVRNKTAFNEQTKLLAEALARGETEFGFVMLDLNNLKLINDNYGHEKGDAAINNLCRIVCKIFEHSPVFRVGGDEFVVVLKNEDYRDIESLVGRFKTAVRASAEKKNTDPWDRVSAAIGYALYDPVKDDGPQSVLSRADHEMYICKKDMKVLTRS